MKQGGVKNIILYLINTLICRDPEFLNWPNNDKCIDHGSKSETNSNKY